MDTVKENEKADHKYVDVDADHDETGRKPIAASKEFSRKPTLPMKYFLESRHLDPEIVELLQQYDTDGDGVFAKEEVISVILELKHRARQNTLLRELNEFYRKMTITMAVVFVVLLLGFVGLSVAAFALTVKMEVGEDGTAVSKADSAIVISTDSAARVFDLDYTVNGGTTFCVSEETAMSIRNLATEGRGVTLNFDKNDGTSQVINLMQVEVDGADGEDSTTFRHLAGEILMEPTDVCNTESEGSLPMGITLTKQGTQTDEL